MAVTQCAHCGSTDLMTQVDNWQCLNCGYHTRIEDESAVAKPDLSVAPSPAAQRLMHAPGNNDNVHPELQQVGQAEWGEHVDPHEVVVHGEDEEVEHIDRRAEEPDPHDADRRMKLETGPLHDQFNNDRSAGDLEGDLRAEEENANG